jgi:formylglycine-generating enzyme required for sulfatase activity
MSASTDGRDWIASVEQAGARREFGAADLPITIGSGPGTDIRIEGLPGSIQIGRLGDVFFVQAGRHTRNLRVEGQAVTGTRPLENGATIAFDRARFSCEIAGGRLVLRTEINVTAGDTAPPDLEELARGSTGAATRDSDEVVTPVAFKLPPAVGSQAKPPPWSKAKIGATAGLAVLAVFAWFAFTAKSVALNFDPEPDEVSMPSTLFKVFFGDHVLLRPGMHRVAAKRTGYYPLDTQIEVSKSSDQSIELKFLKLPGLVTITTDPETRAHVLLDGMPFGETPLADAEITPGLHRIELSADRYLPQLLEIEVAGASERQSVIAKLTPNWAPVTLRTQPAGATVLVDGEAVGVSPLEMQLTAGERSIEVRLSGYNAWSDKVLVSADTPLQLPDVRLSQADGRVEVGSSPTEANVSIDGEFRGRTPLNLRLTPGRTHTLTITKPGYETATRELSVAADSGRKVQIELTAQYGEIEVASTPNGAEVWVDGERRAATPAKLTLTGVSHEVEVRQPGFSAAMQKVTPRPGFPQKLEFSLMELDRGTGSGYATIKRTSLGQELKIIPSGQFTMGSSRREQGRRSNEILRPVRLTRAFYLGVREVTNAEFRACIPEHSSGEFNGRSLNEDNQPVVNVTADQAMRYLNCLSVRDGLQPVYEERQSGWVAVRPLRNGYRLPTEAEWEWAARFAGRDAGLVYPWGTELPPPDRSGNYGDISAREILPTTLVTYNDGYPVSAPVGSFEPNAVGIHDLGGNVAEWVQDFYAIDSAETTVMVEDPLGPEDGRYHLVRGASWRSATVTDLRVAGRGYGDAARDDLGFRIARNLE